ncbi:hypothetical protein EB796_024250 [Bugula neritina]|uniref:Uncharacterized protein n=1 Tax=Bugula neritina TaxID=10212 RepID=A0A7J7IU95_BUGNE|nr:hypothetical protein EB796_024250 [Bugula neritina]
MGTCWVLCTLLLVCGISCINGETPLLSLQGTANSYAAFSSLSVCPNSQLTLNFKSHLPNGLLAYMDYENNSFIQLKLEGGAVKLRVRLSNGNTLKLSTGENLHDWRWHKVSISWSQKVTQLKVGNSFQTGSLDFGSAPDAMVPSNSLLYVGGLPNLKVLILEELSLPTVYYEPRFSGAIVNISYINCSSTPTITAPELLSYDGLRTSEDNQCTDENTCENGGRCLNTNNGPYCDCKYTSYGGANCSVGECDQIF